MTPRESHDGLLALPCSVAQWSPARVTAASQARTSSRSRGAPLGSRSWERSPSCRPSSGAGSDVSPGRRSGPASPTLARRSRAPEPQLLHRCFDTWRGVGDVVTGMQRHGFQVSLGDHGAGQGIPVF